MLPDTIHKLPESERFAYARVLAAIARSDDEITIEEMAMFEQRLGTALLSPGQRNVIRQSLKSDPIPLPELLEDIGPEGGKLALRDAVMMAAGMATWMMMSEPTSTSSPRNWESRTNRSRNSWLGQ